MLKLVKNIILILIVLAVLSVVSHFIYLNMAYVSTENAQIDGHSTMISPKISGFITKVNVVPGQMIPKDFVMVEIDKREIQNSLKQVQSLVDSLTARLADAQTNHQRAEMLYKNGAATKQQYDTNLTNYLDFKAQYESAVSQLSQAKLNLEYTEIKAPNDGIVAKTSAEEGQFASVGVPLIGFVGSKRRWVTANFKETEINDIQIGEKAEVSVDAFPGKKFMGQVQSFSSATGASFTLLPPDNATGNFTKIVQRVPVRIELLNLTQEDIVSLKIGLSVVVKIKNIHSRF